MGERGGCVRASVMTSATMSWTLTFLLPTSNATPLPHFIDVCSRLTLSLEAVRYHS